MNIADLSKRLIGGAMLAGPSDRRLMQEAAAAIDELTALVAAHEAELADLQVAYNRALRAPSISEPAALAAAPSSFSADRERMAHNLLDAKYLNPMCAEFGCQYLAAAPSSPEGDLPTEHLNRCKLRDNLLYADIFNDDGSHRAAWRCHKRAGHDGPCSSHNDCGVMNGGVVCGKLPGHAGPHEWATKVSV